MENHAHTKAADIFMSLQSARAGVVKGEARASGHADEIELRGWRWGMSANSDAASRGSGQASASARRSLRPLVVDKHFDRASTGLMAALAANDTIKELNLTMRKAGDGQQDFLKITLKGAALTEIDHVADQDGNILERLTFSYAHVDVEYRVQEGSGQLGGATTFNADV
jgi:type VI secretion system secreted protein Hcp